LNSKFVGLDNGTHSVIQNHLKSAGEYHLVSQ
jgi:hypothetical protein